MRVITNLTTASDSIRNPIFYFFFKFGGLLLDGLRAYRIQAPNSVVRDNELAAGASCVLRRDFHVGWINN